MPAPHPDTVLDSELSTVNDYAFLFIGGHTHDPTRSRLESGISAHEKDLAQHYAGIIWGKIRVPSFFLSQVFQSAQ